MKPIDKLRTAARNMAKGRNLENHDECNLLLIIADEIEAEIAANYLELPVDADGVPIRVGDICEWNGDQFEVRQLRTDGDYWWAVERLGAFYMARECHHVKPRTLEDVLVDMLEAAVGYSDAHTDVSLVAVEKYADEIRELLSKAGD